MQIRSSIPVLKTIDDNPYFAGNDDGLEALLFNKPVGVGFTQAEQALHLWHRHCSLFLFCHGESSFENSSQVTGPGYILVDT